jgi:hypothetical protein
MSRTAYPGTMARSDLEVVLDEWVRPEFPADACGNVYPRALSDPEETIRRGFMVGLLSRDEARYLLGIAAAA